MAIKHNKQAAYTEANTCTLLLQQTFSYVHPAYIALVIVDEIKQKIIIYARRSVLIVQFHQALQYPGRY